ncbi:DUF3833 domain-containing protein [Sneathiella sp.]|jgi:hypothetical protein|uniref:DUF3833 domain-containing protein n=1 Tax=Sneathiella sp. TaxID=1964365 RepID=UPI0039E4C7E3
MRALFLFPLLLILTGCNTMKPEQFKNATPALDLFEYFDGKTTAWGIFEDRFGNLRRQFKVDIDGTVNGDTLVLDEAFVYADGEKSRRVWTIIAKDAHRFEGSADDVIGKAVGISYGNSLNWTYEMDLKVEDSVWRVKFDDWLFRQPDDVIINRATVTRWGFEIGTVTLFFTRDATAALSTE